MNEELKSLIEDAAKLLGIGFNPENDIEYLLCHFNPRDPKRGDLMKVAEAAELIVDFEFYTVTLPVKFSEEFDWIRGDYQSLAIAILRAASAVYKSRGGV